MTMRPWIVLLLAAAPASASLDAGVRLIQEGRYAQAIEVLEKEAKEKATGPVLAQLGWAYWYAERTDGALKAWSKLVELQPNDPYALRLLASVHLERRKYKEAEALARRALKAAPNDREAPLVLSRALMGQGRNEEAARLLERVIQTEPEKPGLPAGAGSEDPKIALEAVDKVIEQDPSNAEHRKRRAALLFRLDRATEGIKELEPLAQRRPPDPDAMLQLGWAYLRERKVEQARKLSAFLSRLDPGNPEFMRLTASVELQKRDYKKAVAIARKALEKNPAHKESALVLAKGLIGMGRHKEAMALIDRLMGENPEAPDVRFERAGLLAAMGKSDDSMGALEDLIRTDPGNRSYRKHRAQLLYDAGRYDEAAAEWKLLSVEDPGDAGVLMQLGWVLLKAEKYAEALVLAEKLRALDPSDARADRFRATVLIEMGSPEEGIRWAKTALKRRPDDADTQLVLAKGLVKLRREREALVIVDRLLKRGVQKPPVWHQMAGLMTHFGRDAEAIAYYERLCKHDPGNVDWRRQRAEAYYQAGRFKEATADWRELASGQPPDARSLKRLAEDAYFRKDWEEFFHHARRLAEVQEFDASMWSLVAAAHYESGDLSLAQNAADHYIEKSPSNLEAHLFKAELLEAVPDWPAAKRIYEFALTKNPNNRRAWDALARIAAEQGDYEEAIRIQRVIRERYFGAHPYPLIREAAWRGQAGDTEGALELLRPLVSTRPTVVPVLLYHGISKHDRADAVTIENFRAQLEALKQAGYESVSVAQLEGWYLRGQSLPAKPVLITFDDARMDSFLNGDPVLKATGFKATMFVHLSALEHFPFHASPGELKRWAETGRWELQSHSAMGHEPLTLDPAGRTGRFFANRQWVPDEYRLETPAEFRKRVEADYKTARDTMRKDFPKARIVGFAYPFGEYGHMGMSNHAGAVDVNRELVRKYFTFAFVQDKHGFNLVESTRTELTRFEVERTMTAEQLLEHLRMDEPWVQAKLTEARVKNWMGQPTASLAVLRELEASGVKGAELDAEKGAVLEQIGQLERARRLYSSAWSDEPERDRYRRLVKRAERKVAPSVTTEYRTFSDDSLRENTRAVLKGGATTGDAQVEVFIARESYFTGRRSNEAGQEYRADGTEAGLNLRIVPFPVLALEGGLSRRELSSGSDRNYNAHRFKALLRPAHTVRLSLEKENSLLELADTISAGLRRSRSAVRVEWDPNSLTTLAAAAEKTDYNDGNSQQDERFEVTRTVNDWLGVGYAFRHGDSEQLNAGYWTPRNLRQHMGLVRVRHAWESLRGRLQYGRGYGVEELRSRNIQTIAGSVEWLVHDNVSLLLDVATSESPRYRTRQVTGGLNVRF